MKLELKHLAPYLPYGLKYAWKDIEYILEVINPIAKYIRLVLPDKSYTYLMQTNEDAFIEAKPILRPLSDLTKLITIPGHNNGKEFVPTEIEGSLYIRRLHEKGFVSNLTYWETIQQLFQWHFDVFGLIEKGLAVDINTLDKEE